MKVNFGGLEKFIVYDEEYIKIGLKLNKFKEEDLKKEINRAFNENAYFVLDKND